MPLSPRLRRLRSDFRAMQQLKAVSQILDFSVPAPLNNGTPDLYFVRFHGRGLWKPVDSDRVLVRESHEVVIRLGASYPRMMPDLGWKTPIFHPNVATNGVVCLGGYSTHWVPSLQLDDLCAMLWDMIRYKNFDVDSPYNRAAANWAREQTQFRFPLDPRPLRDVAVSRTDAAVPAFASTEGPHAAQDTLASFASGWQLDDDLESRLAEVAFVDDEIIEAEIVDVSGREAECAEILYIE